MKYLFLEILKFIKNNFWKIFLMTMAFTVLYVGREYLVIKSSDEKIESIHTEGIENTGEESDIKIQDVAPASFQFYIENAEDNRVFSNNVLIEEYLTLPYVLEEVAESTNTSIDSLVKETNNEIAPSTPTSDRIKVIHVNRDTNSNLQAIYVNVGNEQANMRIIRYFQKIVQDGSIPFLEDKDVYIFKRPYIVDFADEDEDELTQQAETLSNWNPIKSIIVGIIIGGVLSIGLLVFFNMFSKTLRYFFFYTILDDDYFILVDNQLDNEDEISSILLHPKGKNTIILKEDNLEQNNQKFENFLNSLIKNNNIVQYNHFSNIDMPNELDQIVYIVKEGITKREWYNKQRKMEKQYNIPTIVIQINESS